MRIKPLASLFALVVLAGSQQPVAAQFYGPPMNPAMQAGGYAPFGPPPSVAMLSPYGPMMAGNPAALQPMPAHPAAPAAGQAAGGCGSCGDPHCQGHGCDPCGWCHGVVVYGEFLYLRPRDAEVAYGVPINGAIVPAGNPIQVGRIGVTDPDFQPGFRFGAGYVLDNFASVAASYTWFEAGTSDQIGTDAPEVIRSLVSHPGSQSAATDFLAANADQYMKFQFIDLDYRALIGCGDLYEVTGVIGARYAELQQDFTAEFLFTGSETVTSDIYFSGAGLRGGLEFERYAARSGFMVYGKTFASLIAGDFRASYRQEQSFDPLVVDTNWRAGRIVPILDLELGFGWTSKCDTWHLSAGYLFSGWFNTVNTDRWINAVQDNNFVDFDDHVTFDGLTARIEARF